MPINISYFPCFIFMNCKVTIATRPKLKVSLFSVIKLYFYQVYHFYMDGTLSLYTIHWICYLICSLDWQRNYSRFYSYHQTISFIEISIEAGILIVESTKHASCWGWQELNPCSPDQIGRDTVFALSQLG